MRKPHEILLTSGFLKHVRLPSHVLSSDILYYNEVHMLWMDDKTLSIILVKKWNKTFKLTSTVWVEPCDKSKSKLARGMIQIHLAQWWSMAHDWSFRQQAWWAVHYTGALLLILHWVDFMESKTIDYCSVCSIATGPSVQCFCRIKPICTYDGCSTRLSYLTQ